MLFSRSGEVQSMMAKLKEEEEKLKKAESTIAVMTMLKEGTVPETVASTGELCIVVVVVVVVVVVFSIATKCKFTKCEKNC